MIRINLLPVREKKKKESTRKMFSILALFIGLVALVIVFFHLSLSSQINSVQAQIKSYNEEIIRLKIDTKDVDKFKAEKEATEHHLHPPAGQDGAGPRPGRAGHLPSRKALAHGPAGKRR